MKLKTLSAEELRHELETFRASMMAEFRHRPMFRDVPFQSVASAAGVCDLTFATPRTGKLFDIRRLSVCGVDPTTDVAFTTARLYLGEAGDPYALADTFTSANGGHIPNIAYYSADQLNARTGDRVVLRVTGLAASTALLGNMAYMIREHAIEETTIGNSGDKPNAGHGHK
jgi:hypothetical protein